MKIKILTILCLTFISCSSENNMGIFSNLFGKKDIVVAKTENKNTDNSTNMNYRSKLLATKKFYPFERWSDAYHDGLTQYTKENCNLIEIVFDDLINSLDLIGENANEAQKVELFKSAILKTNQLNDEIEGFIETGEREDLCELTDLITIACGLDPNKYGDGEGLASQWREW